MEIIKAILANWDNVLAVLVLAVFIAALVVLAVRKIKAGETSILKQIIFGLVTDAEAQFGDGNGALKYATVAGWVYDKIPAFLKPWFSEKDIENMIEVVLNEAQVYWSKNESAAGYLKNAKLAQMTAITIEGVPENFGVGALELDGPHDAQGAAQDAESAGDGMEDTEGKRAVTAP